jgi:D-ribose pyranose/furanose isomerase RbsD
MKKLRTLSALIFALVLLPALEAAHWKETLKAALPLLGHRNWIVVADSAYPRQVSPGVQTIPTGATQETVTQAVLEALAATRHVKPLIYLDEELAYVPEDAAPGVSAYRESLNRLLAGAQISRLPHEQIIGKLDGAGRTFQILLLKTNMTIPYTSVFFELECGYWDAASEKRLRELMSKN